jgi:S-adenosylhomocysteine hydrolase
LTPNTPALAHWRITDEIPLRLPLLDRWLELAAHDRPLKGVTVLNIQHQLGNHVPQATALIELGVSPSDVYWIEIPYSATPSVRAVLFELGIPRENVFVSDFRLLDDYANYQRARVQRFLRQLADDPPERLLVLDDGAYMLEALAAVRRPLPPIAIVEQTTRGLIKMEDNRALAQRARELRIVNVARSKPKTTLEPPFIGIAVKEALARRLGPVVTATRTSRCLVLGYGAIGRQVANFLASELECSRAAIYVFDVMDERMRTAVADGFRTWVMEEDLRFNIIVGCSGRASFHAGDYIFLEDGAVLASATSGTVELSREAFIELADAVPDDDIWIDRTDLDEEHVHSDIHFHFVDREATFLNGGFPVNFDGHVNCIPPHYIQPTPTMMCAAAVQAVSAVTPGLIELSHDFSRWLEFEFRAELADEAALLPKFD